MKKFTILMAFVALASFAMAQAIQAPSNIACKNIEKDTRTMVEKYMERQALKANAAWTQDFDGAEAWTTYANPVVGQYKWQTVNVEQFMAAGWGDFENGWYLFPMADSATDANKWAFIDIYGPILRAATADRPDSVANMPVVFEAYIQFDDIDLSTVNNPMLLWNQYYRTFNASMQKLYVDVSVDGATWTSYQINKSADIPHGEYAEYEQALLLGIAANESNVSIRFRWTHDRTTYEIYGTGYAWGIDDVMVIETPQYDLKHLETAMNFFVYIDYHEAANANGYHYSGHFGQIPKEQMDTEASYMFFNTIVENNGLQVATPIVKVEVTNPEGTVVYNNTITGPEIASGAVDTIDIMAPEFGLEAPIVTGEYVASIEITIQGQEDQNPNNNLYETRFFVTGDGRYARDLDNITQSYGLAGWNIGGNDEEMLATTYFINETTTIESVDVYIEGDPDAEDWGTIGNTVQLVLLSWSGDQYVAFAESEPLILAAEHLNTWVNFTFADNTEIIVDLVNEGVGEVLVAVKMFYTGSYSHNTIDIGMDKSTNFGVWSGWYRILDSGEWKWYYGASDGKAFAIRINLPHDNYVKEDVVANFKVYPNPTQDILKIETQSQKSILNIYSVDGKLVRNIEVSNNAEINVSEFATGVYTVVLTDENGNVGTQRFIKN